MDTHTAGHIWGYRLQVHHKMFSQASLSGALDSEKLDKPAPHRRGAMTLTPPDPKFCKDSRCLGVAAPSQEHRVPTLGPCTLRLRVQQSQGRERRLSQTGSHQRAGHIPHRPRRWVHRRPTDGKKPGETGAIGDGGTQTCSNESAQKESGS